MEDYQEALNRRQQSQDDAVARELEEECRLFGQWLADALPHIYAGLAAHEFPQEPRSVFCLVEHELVGESVWGYYLGSCEATKAKFVLLLLEEGKFAIDRNIVDDMLTIATREKFTEHDIRNFKDRLTRMLELAPAPVEKPTKWRSLFRRNR